ncbi:MAG: ribose 5-phosphate isomerase B [Defluviitaleaceae bacterium]|nr:ribose 5-phosphate isomerase B [Defluviitaleaceae bacterium]
MKLAIGNDHTTPEMKEQIKSHLEARGIEVIDVSPNTSPPPPYPVSGYKAGKLVAEGSVDGGVLLCGTGVGMSLAANKIKGVRACLCSEPFTARLSKQHNNANVITFGGRVVGLEMAKTIVDAWLDAEYEGGRHIERVDMITVIENGGVVG